MKKRTLIFTGLVGLLLTTGITLFWPGAGTTSIQLSGPAGTHFTGFYVQGGQRVDVAATLPWSLQRAGITQFEFRKAEPAGDFAFVVKRGGLVGFVGRFYISGGGGQEVVGLHGQLDHWSINIRGIRLDT
jgi:hypothetical protein